jgi:hypothetical protein
MFGFFKKADTLPPPALEALLAARPGIAAHAALWEKAVRARLALRPPASLDAVQAFENESGIRLPDDFVCFITLVGNGGLPPCRLLGLDGWNDGYWTPTVLRRDLVAPCLITPELEAQGENWLAALVVADAELRFEREEWDPMRGSMTIAEFGCGLFWRMIVNGPHYGRVFLWGERLSAPPAFMPEPNFAGWISRHLDAKIAGQPVPFLDGRMR